MNHTLGSSGGATAVHDEEGVRERHLMLMVMMMMMIMMSATAVHDEEGVGERNLVVISVTFETDGDGC